MAAVCRLRTVQSRLNCTMHGQLGLHVHIMQISDGYCLEQSRRKPVSPSEHLTLFPKCASGEEWPLRYFPEAILLHILNNCNHIHRPNLATLLTLVTQNRRVSLHLNYESAADVEDLACDPSCFPRAEEPYNISNFIGPSYPAQRATLNCSFAHSSS